MANPMIGADSRLDTDTVIVSPAQDADFPASNLSDDRAFTTFKPGSAATTVDIITDFGSVGTNVNYFMMVGHNLGTIGSILVEFADSADNISYNAATVSVTPTDDKIILRTFSTVNNRFFRTRMTGASFTPSIGQLQWGVRVDFDFPVLVGFDPQRERLVSRINRSQTGQILGAISTYVERRADIDIPFSKNASIRSTTAPGGFQDFWDNHATSMKSFVFAWNPGNPGTFEKDAFFAILDPQTAIDRSLSTPLDTGLRNLDFSIVGLKE